MSHALATMTMLFSNSVPTPGISGHIAHSVQRMETAMKSYNKVLTNPNCERHINAILEISKLNPLGACSIWENALLVNPWDILALFCLQVSVILIIIEFLIEL